MYNSMNNNNNITNNYNILTFNEKNNILRSRFGCLEKIAELAQCSNYNQFKNILKRIMHINILKSKLHFMQKIIIHIFH